MEVKLDKNLSELRIFPAIDISSSGTRKEELLLSEEELDAVRKLRRSLSEESNQVVVDNFFEMLSNTKSNEDFVAAMNKISFRS